MNQSVLDIPRSISALAEWISCMVYICQCPQHRTGRRLILPAAIALLLQTIWMEATGSLAVVFWIPCMTVALGLMFLTVMICTDIPMPSVGYCTIRAFLAAEFAAALEWQLRCYAVIQLKMSRQLDLVLLAIIYAIVFSILYRVERHWKGVRFLLTLQWKDLIAPLAIGLTSFFLSNLSFVYSNTPFSGTTAVEIFNIRTLMALSGMITLYVYHSQSGELFFRQELDAIQNILRNQYIQYRQSRESIDLINRKYHDLKNQIAILRAEQDQEQRLAFLDKMEDEIKAYETQNKTGNSVLDTLLTGKGLYCARHQIELTCVADGVLLNFLDVMDVCAIFGNALDNAIEHVLTIPEKNRRIIRVTVTTQKKFLIIRVENYLQGDVRVENGLPITTKNDPNYHGFGLKSIRSSTEKYGGSVIVDTQQNWFRLRILIPMPE